MQPLKPIYIEPIKKDKAWGYEIWMVNNNKYCGKILHFNKGTQFSMHYHMIKDETWYIKEGQLIFKWIDTRTADIIIEKLQVGNCIRIPPGLPHQLYAETDCDIIEISTEHYEEDSYRVIKGDSQIPV